MTESYNLIFGLSSCSMACGPLALPQLDSPVASLKANARSATADRAPNLMRVHSPDDRDLEVRAKRAVLALRVDVAVELRRNSNANQPVAGDRRDVRVGRQRLNAHVDVARAARDVDRTAFGRDVDTSV